MTGPKPVLATYLGVAIGLLGGCRSSATEAPEGLGGSSDGSGPVSSTTIADSSSSAAEPSTSAADSTDESSTGTPSDCLTMPGHIPPGTPVVVDGSVAPGEWADAGQFTIDASPTWSADVGVKHDGESLLIVFAQFQPPSAPPAIAFPEVMLDVGNDKLERLGADDWWFHVSATDCAAIGELDNYEGCVPEADGWEANNFSNGPPIDLVEIRIDFATLGLDAQTEQDLGLLLRLSDTQGFATHWPTVADPLVPATWATARICPGPS